MNKSEYQDRIDEQKRYIKVLEEQNEDLKKRLGKAEEELEGFKAPMIDSMSPTMIPMEVPEKYMKKVKHFKNSTSSLDDEDDCAEDVKSKPTKFTMSDDELIKSLNEIDLDEPSAMKSRWA